MRGTRMGLLSALVATFVLIGGGLAEANHWWDGHMWATKDGVVGLYAEVSDVKGAWTQAAGAVLGDWDRSPRIELDTSPTGKQGVVTLQSASYGPNGWLGIAMVNLERGRIISGRVLLNEWYWSNGFVRGMPARQHVLCQEVGHVFGLGHRPGRSCLNDRASELGKWVHPDFHDYQQLESIYSQVDGYDSGSLSGASSGPQRARAAQNWVVVHAYPAPD